MTGLIKTLGFIVGFAALAACDSADERAEAKYQSALALYAEGDLDRAVVELRNVFQLNGAHKEGRRKLAEIFIEQDKIRDAYGQYLRLAEQFPDDLDTRIQLARLAFEIRNWEELERHAAEAINLSPDDDRVKIIQIAMRYRDAVETNEEAERAAVSTDANALLETYPDDDILRKVLIDAAIRRNDYDEGIGHIDHMIALRPNDKLLYQQRLGVIARGNDPAAIEAELLKIVEVFPNDVPSKSNVLQFYVSRTELDKAEDFLRSQSDPADEDVGAFTDLIRFLAEVKGSEAALVEIDRGIEMNANPTPFRALRSGLRFLDGQQVEAIAELEDVIASSEAGETTNLIKLQLASMLQQLSNQVGAQRLVEEVLVEEETNAAALKMQAVWQIAADETDDAISALRLILDQDSEDASAMLLLSEAYTRAGSHELSRDFLALAVDASGNAPAETIRYANVLIAEERLRPAEDTLLDALRIAPGNVDVLALLGQVYLDMGDRPRTTQVIDTLRRQDSDGAVRIADQLQAIQLQRSGGSDEALSFLEQLAGQNQEDVNTQLMLVRGRLATGDVEGANRLIDDLADANPTNNLIQYAKASVKKATNQPEAAEDIFRSLIAVNENAPRLWLELSDSLNRQSKTDEASAVIEEGLAANPDDPNLLWGKASMLERMGDIEGAIAIYEDLYDSPANGDVVANNLASLLTNYRDDDESLERAYTVSRRLNNTKVPAFQDTYGWIAHLRGDSAEALTYLSDAAIGLPDDAVVQLHYAQVLLALERTEEGIAQLQKALNIAGAIDTRPQIEAARQQLLDLQSQ